MEIITPLLSVDIGNISTQHNDNRFPPSYESIYGVPGSTEEFDPRISVISESSLARLFLKIIIYF